MYELIPPKINNDEYEVVTVATHNEGKLNEILDNKYVPVTVLGYGERWTGFKMKYELMYEYIEKMDDNKIIIFLDGFDSEILKHPSIAVEKFKEKGYKILFSREYSGVLLDKMASMVFTSCGDGIALNSGLYMGYVKYLKLFFSYNLSQTCKDDQRTANQSCSQLKFISIDKDFDIFQNIPPYDTSNTTHHNPIFISYPGTVSIKRCYRAIFEYGQFFVKYILLVYIVLATVFIFKKCNVSFIVLTLFLVYIFYTMDWSCY
jgi:hypothetical protein